MFQRQGENCVHTLPRAVRCPLIEHVGSVLPLIPAVYLNTGAGIRCPLPHVPFCVGHAFRKRLIICVQPINRGSRLVALGFGKFSAGCDNAQLALQYGPLTQQGILVISFFFALGWAAARAASAPAAVIALLAAMLLMGLLGGSGGRFAGPGGFGGWGGGLGGGGWEVVTTELVTGGSALGSSM